MMRLAAFAAYILAIFAPLSAAAEQAPPPPEGLRTAVFAGGCFWCVESDFDKLRGVTATASGYTGGARAEPTYRDHEGHVEAVEITYDPNTVSYRTLVDFFLRHIDPFDDEGQFCDRGDSYRTAIFFSDAGEEADARAAIAAGEAFLKAKIVTPVRPRAAFWIAEDYHQDYYKKNPARYRYYRSACGRDRRVKEVWGRGGD
jgi:peptide-methionine (S)-S-oxide reductase